MVYNVLGLGGFIGGGYKSALAPPKAGCQIKFTVVNIVRGKLQRLRQKDE